MTVALTPRPRIRAAAGTPRGSCIVGSVNTGCYTAGRGAAPDRWEAEEGRRSVRRACRHPRRGSNRRRLPPRTRRRIHHRSRSPHGRRRHRHTPGRPNSRQRRLNLRSRQVSEATRERLARGCRRSAEPHPLQELAGAILAERPGDLEAHQNHAAHIRSRDEHPETTTPVRRARVRNRRPGGASRADAMTGCLLPRVQPVGRRRCQPLWGGGSMRTISGRRG